MFFLHLGSKPGKPTVFTADQELAFANKLWELGRLGFGLTRNMVCVKAAEFAEKQGINGVASGKAGNAW